jgi:splicing factor 45
MANDPMAPARGGLSLYANLLDPKSSTPGSISSAPVSYKQENAENDEAAKQQQSLAGT